MIDLLSTTASIAGALLAFFLMISVIVTIHEWGHYRAARCFGLIGTVFSVGFGKKLISFTDRHGTEWRFAPILLGGYVKFPGEAKEELLPGQKTLNSLPRWQRAIVVAAGPAINLVSAALIFAAIAYTYGYPAGRPTITAVQTNTPAAIAGLAVGDEIKQINGERIMLAADVTEHVLLHPGAILKIDVLRDGAPLRLTATLGRRPYDDSLGNKAEIGFLGISMPVAFERSPTIATALTKGVSDGSFTIYTQLLSLKQILTGERRVTELSGPLRIAKMSSHTFAMGPGPFLYLMAIISIAVGVMNLLPIPGMDGGHLATYAVEGLMRRDIPVTLAQAMLKVGIFIILCMSIFAVTLDIVALA